MDKETLVKKRSDFFEYILEQIKRPPARMDEVLQQSQYYMPVYEADTFFDATAGDLAICIQGKFYDKEFKVYYSFWQLGEMLRVGVALNDEDLQTAFSSDSHNEVYYIWGMNNNPRVDVTHGCVYYDWEFVVPKLYDNYFNQERFVLGARHMHFRVMRILHDECFRIYSANKEQDESPLSLEEFTNIIDNDKE